MPKTKKPKRDAGEVIKMKQDILDLENKWKRALADYQNLEKRIETQQSAYIRLASLGLVDKLLPVLDDLERASQHIKEDGLKMVVKQFIRVLESEDVKKIDTKNKDFDPEYMDCVEMIAGQKNVVIEEILSGYLLAKTVIRPAKVKVGDGSKK